MLLECPYSVDQGWRVRHHLGSTTLLTAQSLLMLHLPAVQNLNHRGAVSEPGDLLIGLLDLPTIEPREEGWRDERREEQDRPDIPVSQGADRDDESDVRHDKEATDEAADRGYAPHQSGDGSHNDQSTTSRN